MMLDRALRSIRIRLFAPRPKPLILMYHRIADEPFDPWGIAVSPAHFKEHLEVLRRTRQPLALAEFVRGLEAGTLPNDAVALTFDDGYVDNLVAGKPHLAAAGVPATVFLATGYLGRPGEFWWDELARVVLLGAGPRELEITIRGEAMRFSLEDDAAVPETPWHAWSEPPKTARQEAYLAIWRGLRTAEVSERETLMAGLRNAFAGCPRPAGSGRPMTPEEVRTLASDGLMAIGSHTVTHPVLTELDPVACGREITASKRACEELVGGEVRSFAYPFGSLDPNVRAAVANAGFGYACSTRHAPVTSSSDVFALPRIQILDSAGEAFERSLRYASIAP